MAEEIINALTALDGLHVASRTSTFLAKAKNFDIAEIGTRLKVRAVLEGSVRKAGNRLRVTAQLINVSDGYHLWSERYDRDMDDVFAVQDEIARMVVEKLKVKLLGVTDGPLVKRTTENLEAYNLVLKGRYYHSRLSGTSFERGRECFSQALALEPDYAQAHAGIAMVQTIRAAMSFARPHNVMPEAKEAALKALTIDETVSDAHVASATVRHWYEWDWAGAEREYLRALELSPGDAYARGQYALLLAQLGRSDQAIAEARHSVELDPLTVLGQHVLSIVLSLARRFDPAAAEARAGIQLDSSAWHHHANLGWALAGLGQYLEALEAYRQAVVVAPGDPTPLAHAGWALGLTGRSEEARAVLSDLEERRTQEYVAGWLLAHVNLGLGEYERAVVWLEKAIEERDPLTTFSRRLFSLDPLRADPRFQALLQKMNFPETAETPPSA